QGAECIDAIGGHPNLQPVGRAGEHAGAKINRHREQAIADGNSVVGDRSADSGTASLRLKKRESQVVGATGWAAVILELALIRKRRALGQGSRQWGVDG